MFDLVAKHKRIAQVILFLIMIPFAFFGVDYYFRGGGQEGAVATIGGENITQNDFAEAVREQTDQMRRQMGRNFDPRMFENPEVRFALLENLINQRCSRKRRATRSSAFPMRSCCSSSARSRCSWTRASFRPTATRCTSRAEHDPAPVRGEAARGSPHRRGAAADRRGQYRRAPVRAQVPEPARAAARGRGGADRPRAVHEGREDRRGAAAGFLRQESDGVPGARAGANRVRAADPGQADRAGHGRRRAK